MSGSKTNTGLDEELELVKTYVPESLKEDWRREADEQGFPSLSKFVMNKVQIARAEAQMTRSAGSDGQDVERLKDRIDELQARLAEARHQSTRASDSSSTIDVVVQQALTTLADTMTLVDGR